MILKKEREAGISNNEYPMSIEEGKRKRGRKSDYDGDYDSDSDGEEG